MTKKQVKLLLDKTYQHFPDYQESLQKRVQEEYPPSSEDLPKSKLYVRIGEDIPRAARNNFKNDLLNHINDEGGERLEYSGHHLRAPSYPTVM